MSGRPATVHLPTPADHNIALEARVAALSQQVAELTRVVLRGSIAPLGTPAQAARILGVGHERVQRACKVAEAQGESVIFGDIPFRRVGGGAERPRFAVYLTYCARPASREKRA